MGLFLFTEYFVPWFLAPLDFQRVCWLSVICFADLLGYHVHQGNACCYWRLEEGEAMGRSEGSTQAWMVGCGKLSLVFCWRFRCNPENWVWSNRETGEGL